MCVCVCVCVCVCIQLLRMLATPKPYVSPMHDTLNIRKMAKIKPTFLCCSMRRKREKCAFESAIFSRNK